MRERMTELAKRIALAADRRTALDPVARGRLDGVLAVLRDDYAEAPAPSDPLVGVGDVFGLDDVDLDVLAAAAAPDVDANVGLAYGLLRGASGPARLSVGLALEFAGLPSLSAAGPARFGAPGSLRRAGLLEVIGTDPWVHRELRVPDRVLAHLVGVDEPEPAVAAALVEPVVMELEDAAPIAAALEQGTAFAWLRGPLGAPGLSLAAGALAAAGIGCLAIDARRVRDDLPSVLASAAREAALRGSGLVIAGADLVAEQGLCAQLEREVVPVLAVGTLPWNPVWLTRYPLVVEVPALRPADRAVVWAANLGDLADDAGLTSLRLAPEQVVETTRYARMLAGRDGAPLTVATVRAAARRIGGSTTARPSTGRVASFDDLVLPEHVAGSLRRFVSWARHRDELLADGRLVDVGGKGTGLTALFSGNPGTGKTLAAHVIAGELGLELLPVDLSAIVDKYVGETEKNLERVFHEAESLNVVLFFDEADALFGKRSDVKDAHDRYANQEVAYLLQRMEHFDGITVLATNLRGNLDSAFSRRMSMIVHFPDPDAPTRKVLWRSHLDRVPALDPDDPVDVAHLATTVELAGGDIRNIVLAAAYDAIGAGEAVGMRHVLAATVSEYHKLGRRVPAEGFDARHTLP